MHLTLFCLFFPSFCRFIQYSNVFCVHIMHILCMYRSYNTHTLCSIRVFQHFTRDIFLCVMYERRVENKFESIFMPAAVCLQFCLIHRERERETRAHILSLRYCTNRSTRSKKTRKQKKKTIKDKKNRDTTDRDRDTSYVHTTYIRRKEKR